jgi:hypothetical protein
VKWLEVQNKPTVNNMDLLTLLVLIVISVPLYLIAYYVYRRCVQPPVEPSADILQELKALRAEWARLSVRFLGEGFTEDDGPAFLLAVANAIHRFDTETRLRREGGDEGDLLTEAQGYVAILGLALSWAEANKNEGMRMRAKELLQRADTILQRVKQL